MKGGRRTDVAEAKRVEVLKLKPKVDVAEADGRFADFFLKYCTAKGIRVSPQDLGNWIQARAEDKAPGRGHRRFIDRAAVPQPAVAHPMPSPAPAARMRWRKSRRTQARTRPTPRRTRVEQKPGLTLHSMQLEASA